MALFFFIKKLSHFIIILYHKSRRLSTILAKNRPHIFARIFFLVGSGVP